MNKKPNILFIHCDSMDGRVMGCAGHPAAYTPNLDRLAARGTRFANTYTPSPVCLPARVATWTGRHCHHSKAWSNCCGMENDEETFLSELEAAGYESHSIGRDDRFQDAHSLRLRLGYWTRHSEVFPGEGSPPKAVVDTDKCERVREVDWKHTDAAMEWMEARSNSGKPFFLSLGYINPHPMAGYRSSPFYLEKIDAARVTLPGQDRTEHPSMQWMRRAKGCGTSLPEETILEIRTNYCAMVAEIDRQVGVLLQHLERTGLAESTVVIFFSDHGDMQMEHGQWRKSTMFEASVRVPLILAGPGIASGVVREDLASLLDLHPTLMDIAGRDPLSDGDGASLFQNASDRPPFVISQYHDTLQDTGSFLYRTGPWKLIEYPGHPSQLFHLENDPEELNDLASEAPEQAEQLGRELRKVLDVEAVDREAKADARLCFSLWRALTGRAAAWAILRKEFPCLSGDDLKKLDAWRERFPVPSGLTHPKHP